MKNVINRFVEIIGFVIGSAMVCIGVVIGGVAEFVVWITNVMCTGGIIMCSKLVNRFADMRDSIKTLPRKTDIVQEEEA